MECELLGEETGTFGQALESLKRGHLVTRKGWNGKGMFIFMRPEDCLSTEKVVNHVKSLPESFKKWIANNYGDSEIDKIKFTAYLCMKAADGTVVNGWLASQTDMLANDWLNKRIVIRRLNVCRMAQNRLKMNTLDIRL